MLLLEHDAKTLLSQYGLAIPSGIWVKTEDEIIDNRLPDGPWIVKAQAATGGRGKAGGIRPWKTEHNLKQSFKHSVRTYQWHASPGLPDRIEDRCRT
ncbi:MAG: hypothetical protein CM1200mP18_03920 [Gammaproteobacteria bacterium]|nr:MAG: hypothetical protein CM1200mP18_03920 [Gammaproteobacteria bacterium]